MKGRVDGATDFIVLPRLPQPPLPSAATALMSNQPSAWRRDPPPAERCDWLKSQRMVRVIQQYFQIKVCTLFKSSTVEHSLDCSVVYIQLLYPEKLKS